jgi:fumarylacetoacetate (FAA) hydrolase family protein
MTEAMKDWLSAGKCLPEDHPQAELIGRIWRPDVAVPGPTLVRVQDGGLYDLSGVAATASQLLNLDDPVASIRRAGPLPRIAALADVLANSAAETRRADTAWLLAPCDLQAIKASGVTFVSSLLERVIEEQARGDAARAEGLRASITSVIGTNLQKIRPGSEEARRLKEVLIAQGVWSQYLEVGIGPDAEIFSKGQPMSAVGSGADVGIHPKSEWNNPEPEIVLACDARGRTLGASLGNDVNLRDIEGRSALLLGKAKDNNASCAIGPFIRMFDAHFSLDDVRQTVVALQVTGEDGYMLEGQSSMSLISRDPLDLVQQTLSQHQYPDGFALFLGTMFAPTEDRGAAGRGFTHKSGDLVRVSAPMLGTLENKVTTSDQAPPWCFGIGELMRNLAARGMLSQGPGGAR